MLKIRKNVFETNSSSTHSLVVSNKERSYDYELPVENGVLTIPFGEFGWGPDILVDPIDKLSYLITDRINIKLAIGEVMIETGTTSSGIRPMNSVRIGITHSAAETETAIRLTMKFKYVGQITLLLQRRL